MRNKKALVAIIASAFVVCVAVAVILIWFVFPSMNYNKAQDLLNSGDYQSALDKFTDLGDYKESEQYKEFCEAAVMEANGQFDEAYSVFDKLGDFNNSSEMKINLLDDAVKKGEYKIAYKYDNSKEMATKIAEDALSKGDYETAADYDNSKEMATKIAEDALSNGRYKTALKYDDSEEMQLKIADYAFNEGDYKTALKYDKSENMEEKIIDSKLKTASDKYHLNYTSKGKRKYFKFGVDFNNKKINWRVLENDGDDYLIISNNIIDALPYNKKNTNTSWAGCSLRKFLNKDFINKAFKKEIRKLIRKTKLKNKSFKMSSGPTTRDKIFCLSIDEANKYFKNNKDRIAVPTKSAKKKIIKEAKKYLDKYRGEYYSSNVSIKTFLDWHFDKKSGGVFWWTRSRTFGPSIFAIGHYSVPIWTKGELLEIGIMINTYFGGIRPALWLHLP